MKHRSLLLLTAALLSMPFLLFGCVQVPTERQAIADLRPQISFKVNSEAFLSARVLLDGLDAGQVGDFVDGAAAMRVRPGMHSLQVVIDGRILLDEKFYLGDGVNKSFFVR